MKERHVFHIASMVAMYRQKIRNLELRLGGQQTSSLLSISLLIVSVVPVTIFSNANIAIAVADTNDPVVSIQEPAASSQQPLGTITITGTAIDKAGGTGVKIVEVAIDSGTYKSAKPKATGDWSTWNYQISITAAGSHTVKARATDNAGNQDWDTRVFSVSGGGGDAVSPAIAITAPSDGDTIAAPSISIKGTASDSGSGVKVVEVRTGDGSYIKATPSKPGDWAAWSATLLVSPGTVQIVARATDNAGNQQWDKLSVTVKDSSSPQPTSAKDQFGIAMLYSDSKDRPNKWFMNGANPNENRKLFDVSEDSALSRNSDGSWKIKDSAVRMNLYNKNGYSGSKIATYDRAELTRKGFMQDVDDWKNVELTMFVKLNSDSGTGYFSPYARSGRHNLDATAANGENIQCEGTGIKPRIYYDGQVAAVKEMWHDGGYATRDRHSATNPLENRWVGIKAVIYDVPLSGGGTGIKQELWVYEGGDRGSSSSWRKVVDNVDSGGWGTNGDDIGCKNARPDQPIFWGGPIVTFRWDNAQDVDFKWLSAREIQPPT